MDEQGTNRRRFMGGIAAGTIGLGLDEPRLFEGTEGILEPPETGDPPSDMFLAISDIEGGSTKSEHEGEIEILSWQFGMERPVEPKSRKGTGEPAFDSLFVWKKVDKASPQLMTSLATGNRHSRATLAVQLGIHPVQVDWLTIELNEVAVTDLTDFGTSHIWPAEGVAMTFDRISVAVVELDEVGSVQETWEFEWPVE